MELLTGFEPVQSDVGTYFGVGVRDSVTVKA